jgi:hypothetical protein
MWEVAAAVERVEAYCRSYQIMRGVTIARMATMAIMM